MESVGIKVLKDNLSKYLRMVRDGEIVLVTDRDEVIAEIQSHNDCLRLRDALGPVSQTGRAPR